MSLNANLARLALAAALALPLASPPAWAENADTTRQMILNDPAAPVAGNPKGDVTIVAFLDYNCPFCKKSAPSLEKLVKTDGKIRLVYKDWPILTDASLYGARLALAAKYQGKYGAVHDALMGIPGRKIPEDKMLDAVKASGVDMARLDADLKAHGSEITALIERNKAQAEGLRLAGTPVYLVGPLFVAAALDYEQFKQAVAQARLRGDKS
ncbi:DsbA family protein [Chenggangzhangella methanolivorans]|nr:DsbA family protein [Chenggangzhangella methanolivorans]